MKLSILAGSTSQTVNIFIRDSSSTTGAGLTGLAFNTASLTAYYALPKAAAVSITLATLAAVTTAWSSGGFKEIDATNMPGWYRFDIPDAALASGRFVDIHFRGATNMAPTPVEIQLTATNNQSATAFITGVNSIAPPTNWNLMAIDASGRVDIGKLLGTASQGAAGYVAHDMAQAISSTQSASTVGEAFLLALNRLGRRGTAQAGASTTITLDSGASATDNIYATHSIRIIGGTGSGQIATIVSYVGSTKVATITRPGGGTWTTNPDNTSIFQIEAVPLSAVGFMLFTVLTEGAVGRIAAAWNAFWNVTSPVATAQGVNQTGDSYARIGAPAGASIAADLAEIEGETDTLLAGVLVSVGTGAGQINASGGKVPATIASGDYSGNTAQTGDAYARLGAPAGASVSADILEANADLDELITTVGAAGAGLTALGETRNANLDVASSTLATATNMAEANADLDELIVTVGAAGAGLTAVPDSATVTEIGADVDELIVTVGAAGAGLTALGDTRLANLDATITSRTKPADTQARVTLTDTLTTYTGNTPQTGDSFPFADRTVARGTVGSASTVTSIVTSALTPAGAVADQFKGRIVIFDRLTTTTSLRGQATDITASSASATPTLTVTTLTDAPTSGDLFSIV